MITSFPQQWAEAKKDEELDVLKSIRKYIQNPKREVISSAHDLAAVITKHCLNVLYRCQSNEDLQFMDFFGSSIGRVVGEIPADIHTRRLQLDSPMKNNTASRGF